MHLYNYQVGWDFPSNCNREAVKAYWCVIYELRPGLRLLLTLGVN